MIICKECDGELKPIGYFCVKCGACYNEKFKREEYNIEEVRAKRMRAEMLKWKNQS